MMFFMMTLSLTITTSLLFLNHPLSLGVMLLIQTILVSLMIGFYSYNLWFSYILFMIMVGGMLVLFIYMTSIASNEKFKFSKWLSFISLTFMFIFCLLFMNMDMMILNSNNFLPDMNMMPNFNYFQLSFNKYFNFPSNIIMASLINYLFITLIAVVKITNINFGPLRQKL